jgi:RND superfamily putative drug exporter
MSSALYALGTWAVARRKLVVGLWAGLLVALGVLAGLLHQPINDVFTIPGTQSQRAMDALTARFPEFAGASGQVVVSAPAGSKVTDPAVTARIEDLTARYAALPHVRTAASPFNPNIVGAVSPDASVAIISVQLDTDAANVTEAIRDPLIQTAHDATAAGLPTSIGGAIFMPSAPEMSITEGLGVLVALIVLVATFGSALAAGIPLATAVIGAGASMALILIATRFTAITSTAPFLALMIGLAVGIDYALFVLSRHRDLIAEGQTPDEAAAQATGTAGSAVVFAGATVAIALAALGVAGVPFLSVMGVAAAVAVAVAVAVALTLLPAVLGFAGDRLTPKHTADAHHAKRHTSFAATWVRLVTRLPWLTAIVVVAGLAAMALPARDLALALPNNGTSGPETTQRQAFDTIATAFGPGANAPLVITLDIVTTTDPLGVVADVKKLVADTPGIASISVATPNRGADTGVVIAVPTTAPDAQQTRDTLARVRALGPEIERLHPGVTLAVTGHTAAQVDISERLGGALLPFGILVVGLSLVLLMLVFRSVLVPVTAALGYVLSVGAAFGAVSAVFRWGWLLAPFGLTETGPVIAFMPIILMGVLFGLAMDYQVFLVSSMRARYVHEGDARAAVRAGFLDSSRVVVAAAIIMVAVFAAFVPKGAVYIKPIALGLAVGVFIDAFVVRMTLIPALMQIMGERAWWLPRWLDRRLPVLDVEGEGLHRRLAADQARAARARAHLEHGGLPALAVVAHGLGLRSQAGPIYADVDLEVPVGSLVVVSGPPGAGKTSLLLTLAGRMLATEGSLEVAGRLLPDQLAQARRVTALAEFPGVNDLDPLLSIADHAAERLAPTSIHPWVSALPTERFEARLAELLGYAVSAAPDAHCWPALDLDTRVRDLQPLERWLLGVALALAENPEVIVVDDVDSLRGDQDRVAAWGVLEALVGAWRESEVRADSHGPALTVLASCRDLTLPRQLLHGIPVVELSLPARSGEPEVLRRSGHGATPFTEDPILEPDGDAHGPVGSLVDHEVH